MQFHADLNSAAPKALVTDINSVDKDSADSWGYFINSTTLAGAAALDASAVALDTTELSAFDSALNTFSTTGGNGNLINSLHLTVSGAAPSATLNITANIDAQTAINSADKFKINVTGLVNGGTQAVIDHTGGTPKAVQNYISSASNIYRDSATSWDAYLNLLYSTGIPAASTVDLDTDEALYLSSQAEIDALISALESRADKGNIATLNVKLLPQNYPTTLVFGNGSSRFNPAMTIDVTGSIKNGETLTSSNISYAGSFNATGKTVDQNFLSSITDATNATQWESYFTYYLTSTSQGGKSNTSIITPTLNSGAELTALMTGLNNLSASLKTSLKHLHLDISGIAGAVELGTGVTGLTDLDEVTYIRASGEVNATEAVGSSFVGKTQRLRTAFNSDTIASASTVEEFLRYQLMDSAYGGAGNTIVSMTDEALDTTQAGYVNTAIGNLPSALKTNISELRLNLNSAAAVTFDASGLTNLADVKYFQTGAGAITWTGAPGFGAATKTAFRNLLTDITNLSNQTQWEEYLNHKLSPVLSGGLASTSLDLTSSTLTSANVTAFMGALNAMDNANLVNVTDLKLNVSGYVAGNLTLTGSGGKTYNNALSVRVYTDTAHTGTISLAGTMASESQTLWQFVDTSPAVTDAAIAWQRWLNYQLASTANGGIENTTLDLTASHSFASQAQMNAFFAGLQALTGTSGTANKNLLTDLDLKLASGNFGSNVVIGETGSGPTSSLNAGINVSVDRNGAKNGANTYSPIVTVSFTGGTNGGTEEVIDVGNAATPTLNDSGSWLAYLTDLANQAGFDDAGGNNGLIDLTGASLQLTTGGSANEATALLNGLEALNSTLKAKVKTIKTKLAAGSHGGGSLAISGDLQASNGFDASLVFETDATAATDGSSNQKTIDLSGILIDGTKRVVVSDITQVILSDTTSWDYHINYISRVNGNIESIDLVGQDLWLTDTATTQSNLYALFSAIDARTDKATIKDIFINLTGQTAGNTLTLGETAAATSATGLTALTCVTVKSGLKQNSQDDLVADGTGVAASDISFILSTDNKAGGSYNDRLGLGATVEQWKGYISYFFEDATHGGTYTDKSTFSTNPTNTQLDSDAALQNLEQALIELPVRVKQRIKGMYIKVDSGNNFNGETFGGTFTNTHLSEYANLKVIILDTVEPNQDPDFPVSGPLMDASYITKIHIKTSSSTDVYD